MTCILGYIEGSSVYIVADGQITAGLKKEVSDYDKININGDIIAAFSGTMNSINVLESVFKKVDSKKIITLKDDLYNFFIDPLKKEVSRVGLSGDYLSFSGLIAKKNELFEINNHFNIIPHKKKAGIGSGSQYALGSLETLERTNKLPTLEKLKICMDISDFFDAGSNNNITWADTKTLITQNLKGE